MARDLIIKHGEPGPPYRLEWSVGRDGDWLYLGVDRIKRWTRPAKPRIGVMYRPGPVPIGRDEIRPWLRERDIEASIIGSDPPMFGLMFAATIEDDQTAFEFRMRFS